MSGSRQVTAVWSEAVGQYIVDNDGRGHWYSDDGDRWIDDAGLDLVSSCFENTTIELVGGPRAGELVN